MTACIKDLPADRYGTYTHACASRHLMIFWVIGRLYIHRGEIIRYVNFCAFLEVKSKLEREMKTVKLKMKDGAVVDPDSGLEDEGHVYKVGFTTSVSYFLTFLNGPM